MAIERERLEWQFNELNQLELKPNEWETLSQSHDSLAHSAELLQTAEQVSDSIDGDNGIQRQIYQCQKLLGNLQNIEPRFAESLNMLASIEAELGEISANMRDVAGRSDIDPNELAAQESRMGELMSMARKYRIEPKELPQKLAEIDERLQNLHAAADLEALEIQSHAILPNTTKPRIFFPPCVISCWPFGRRNNRAYAAFGHEGRTF